MMSYPAKLANPQYNSPIRLYSPQNIQEALNKQTHVLANGAVGIDFHNLAKPGNLAHSQVLRMLEEEESMRSGRYSGPGPKKVLWPPPEEGDLNDIVEPSPVVAAPPEPVTFQQAPHSLRGSQPSPPTLRQEASSPVRRVHTPVNFEPPKATVTLLPTAPVRQQPPPVFSAQPAATIAMGGNRSRGDAKWPPETVKMQSAAENEARLALAKGPTCRPRKVKKDYSSFFAQHALNPTYPSYKAPPGTQHFIEEGTSNL